MLAVSQRCAVIQCCPEVNCIRMYLHLHLACSRIHVAIVAQAALSSLASGARSSDDAGPLGGEGLFGRSAMTAPSDLQAVLADLSSSKSEQAANADKEADEDEGRDPDKNGTPQKHWQGDSKIAKATREFEREHNKLVEHAQGVLTEMGKAIEVFQKSPDVTHFVVELKILMHRHEALILCLGSDPVKLTEYINQFETSGQPKQAASDRASEPSSKDMSVLCKSGPCNNYKELAIFADSQGIAARFMASTCDDDIKAPVYDTSMHPSSRTRPHLQVETHAPCIPLTSLALVFQHLAYIGIFPSHDNLHVSSSVFAGIRALLHTSCEHAGRQK